MISFLLRTISSRDDHPVGRLCIALCAVVFLLACSAGVRQPDQSEGTPTRLTVSGVGRIASDDLRLHVEYLASEDLAGRGPGSFQADSTVAYAFRSFLAAGL